MPWPAMACRSISRWRSAVRQLRQVHRSSPSPADTATCSWSRAIGKRPASWRRAFSTTRPSMAPMQFRPDPETQNPYRRPEGPLNQLVDQAGIKLRGGGSAAIVRLARTGRRKRPSRLRSPFCINAPRRPDRRGASWHAPRRAGRPPCGPVPPDRPLPWFSSSCRRRPAGRCCLTCRRLAPFFQAGCARFQSRRTLRASDHLCTSVGPS